MTCRTFVGCISHAVGCRAPSCASDLSCYRFCSKVGISAETKLAIVRHSLNSFPALEFLAGLVEGVVVVGWGDGGMGSRVAISRENYKRRVFRISVVYLRSTWAHVNHQLSI